MTEADIPRVVAHATSAEQLLIAVCAFVVKPAYMILALAFALLLRRQRAFGLSLIRWSLVLFFVGEAACAVNIFAGELDWLEAIHGLGMIGMGALLPWGLAEVADERALRYQDPVATCLLVRFCGRCWKREPVPCGLQRLFLFLAGASALISLTPLCAPLAPRVDVVQVFGTEVRYPVSGLLQILQFRIYPWLGAAAFLASFGLLWRGQRGFRLAKPFFFVGLGFTSFALVRFFLFRAYPEMAGWADIWEELTELVAVAGIGVFLWVFASQLGLRREQRGSGRPTEPCGAPSTGP